MSRFAHPCFKLAAALLFITFSASAQKITTTADKTFDFKSAKRYAWGQNHIITRQGKANDALIDQKIVADVNQTLAAKGFVEDPKNPDFFVSYDAGGSDLSAKIEGAYSPAAPASTAAPTAIYDIPQNLWYSVNGHVTFHVVDAKSNKPVWTALATKKINDPHKAMKDMPKQVEQFVSKAFQKFPPNSK
jgi:hypothetical protein